MRHDIDSARTLSTPTDLRLRPGADRLSSLRGDSSIRAEIECGIAKAPWLDADGVSVVVEHGEVVFAGHITESGTRIALREIAARCAGVRAVDDRLRVTAASDAPL